VRASPSDNAQTHETILVTGAGGCIGSALVQALASSDSNFLILVDHSEQNLYESDQLLQARGHKAHASILGDILDEALLIEVFEHYRPGTIYHAAAFKHVPLMESNPFAAVRNNSIGTWRLAKAAARFEASSLLLISTDKAVHPRSIMGVSKRIAELALLSTSGSNTRMNVLRLGNVYGSRGSVVPLFEQQIERGGPVTVTHPDASRYFLSMDETVAVIRATSSLRDSRSIFVPKLNAPVKILDLAQRMIRERGLEAPRDIQIIFTGLRAGDKLEEELAFAHEVLEPTTLENLQRGKSGDADAQPLEDALERLSECIETRNLAGLLHELAVLVPEYQPSDTVLKLSNSQLAGENVDPQNRRHHHFAR
jgi:FlaA1/EpsC-like NDP-sugar epimerase